MLIPITKLVAINIVAKNVFLCQCVYCRWKKYNLMLTTFRVTKKVIFLWQYMCCCWVKLISISGKTGLDFGSMLGIFWTFPYLYSYMHTLCFLYFCQLKKCLHIFGFRLGYQNLFGRLIGIISLCVVLFGIRLYINKSGWLKGQSFSSLTLVFFILF